MARRSLSSGFRRTTSSQRLADVDIVLPASDGSVSKVIHGTNLAALLDVAVGTEAVLNPEDIARGLENVAALLAALAQHEAAPTDGALYVAEHCLRRLAARVDGLRPGAETLAERVTIIPRRPEQAAHEHIAPYRAALGG